MRPHHCDAFNIEHGMEQTSMTNAIKKRLNRKGFTLAEVLVTVAILLILAGVTFVSVVQYQKNLRLMEMDGTAKEIFIAAQNHLSVAKASGDLDRLAEKAKSATDTTDSTIGTKLDPSLVSAYAGDTTSGEYYYVIHNVTSGIESCTPSGSGAILQMMLPFGALDETVATGGNYAIVYELKSASVVAVLYSGAGNASFGNAAVINFSDEDVSKIKAIYNDKSARKSYQKGDVTAIVGCYTGTAGSAAIPTEILEAPKLEVKNENKLHVIVSDEKPTDTVTLIIRGVQSGTVAQRILKRSTSDGNDGSGTFDVTLDDITGDGSYRFANIISFDRDRFTKTKGDGFIPGENIEISARVSSTTGFATPKESAKYTVSSLFGDVNETKDAGNTTVYIRNLRHLENLGANVSGFTAALGNGTTSGSSKVVNITAEQKNDITMFSMSTSGSAGGNHFENLRGSAIYGMGQEATFAAIDVNYPLVYHGNQHEIHDVSIGAQQDHTAAGIFGQVADPASGAANASLSVSDLILRNNRVSGTNVKNAGMLVGETAKNLTVDGVLAYYHEDTYDETKDSSVEVTASENAGGLIGLVSGGKLDVKNSAAAVYVKGGSAAGGFIGSVSGASADSTIVQSYAGGHTRDGAYSTTDATTNKPVLEGPGRYNVQASGYAGGFIGVTTNKVLMNAVYSTASAYSVDAIKSGSFSGNTETNFGTAKNYYAIGPHNGTDASADDTAKSEIPTGQMRRQATAYDRTLMGATDSAAHPAMDKTSYPLNTIRHFCATSVDDKELPWFIKEHVGDWVVSKKTSGKFEIKNDVRLELDYTTPDTSIKNVVFKIQGKLSGQIMKYCLRITDDDPFTYVIHRGDNGVLNAGWNYPSKKMTVVKNGTGYKFILYLDDITTDDGHFTCVAGNSFIPGEDLEISLSTLTFGQYNAIESETDLDEKRVVNSLFDHVDNNKAYISSIRHLENLDKLVSHIGVKITSAELMNDLIWMRDFDTNRLDQPGFIDIINDTVIDETYKNNTRVYIADKLPHEANCFIPIRNSDLTIFDGKNHTITNLNILGMNTNDGHDAGLFGVVTTDFTIRNTNINYVNSRGTISFSDDNVGVLVGKLRDKTLTIENVSITGKAVVEGYDTAGGIVGYTGGGATDIKQVSCNGEMFVKSKNASGGIIGRTNQSKVTVDTAEFHSKVEVTSDNTHAGGVIGISGGEAEIKNTTFNGVLTVSGDNSSGGVIGNANGKATVDQVTFESDVTVKATSANVHAGGIVGYAAGEADIKNTAFNGKLTVSGENSSAGIVGKANDKVTVNNATFKSNVTVTSKEHAAGVLGDTNSEADIENVTCLGRLIVYGNKSSGGILGNTGNNTGNKLKLWNIRIGGGSTITSVNGDAGGVAGYAQSYDTDIQNVKFIGKDTEVIAKQNAGGLCGTLTKNTSKLKISNVAVSAFIQAEENAGGLIGRLQTSASEGKIEKSYYGGRTWHGQYGAITINNNAKEYTSNIHGSQKAGGLIGYIENTNGLTIDQCFSTGSVENSANNQFAGGFIGVAEQAGVKIKNCYSIGKVGSQNNGGFIGFRNDSSNLTYENADYLNTFNDPFVKAIGNGSDEENNNLTTKYADDVLGKNETSDQTVQTNNYDDALKDEIYPYKNWTTDWEITEALKPISYYGDWPLLKLNGSFVYFDAIDKNKDNYENGGRFNIYSYEKDMNTTLIPFKTKLKSSGFGIISDENKYDELANFYRWSYKIDANDKEKMPCKIEGSEEKDGEHKGEVSKYSKFSYLGKEFYFYRCTFEVLENLKDDTIFVWAEKGPNKGTVYKVDILDNKVSFQLMPNTNPTLNP